MQLTREALHQLVWSKPMGTVARELGVAKAELERLCATLDVPFPYTGFWRGGMPSDARVRALPRGRPGRPDSAILDDPPPPRAPAAAAPEPSPPERPPPVEFPPTLRPDVAAGNVTAGPCVTDVHPIMAARLEAQRRHARAPTAPRGEPKADKDPLSDRYDLIRNRVFLALERAGHGVRTDGQSLQQVRFEVAGQTLQHAIRERYTRTRRPLTPSEARDPWNVLRGRTHVCDDRMTGQLVLTVHERTYGRRTDWRDDFRRGRLEDRIEEIVAGIEALARDVRRVDAEHREREARWQEDAAHRAEAERRAQREEARWARLSELATWHEEARRIGVFLKRLRADATAAGVDPTAAAWFEWAEAELAERDPRTWGVELIVRHTDDARDAADPEDDDWDEDSAT